MEKSKYTSGNRPATIINKVLYFYNKIILRRIISLIFLFIIVIFQSQNLIIYNKDAEDLFVISNNEAIMIKKSNKKEIRNVPSEIIFKDKTGVKLEFQNFLEPDEFLEIFLYDGESVDFKGDKKEIYDYVYYHLNRDSHKKSKEYNRAKETANFKLLRRTSELHLAEIMKNVNLSEIHASNSDTEVIKRLKRVVKYSWLGALLMTANTNKYTDFKQQMLRYFYENYVKEDIATYSCNGYTSFSQHFFLSELVKARDKLNITLPEYEIFSSSDEDNINIYLPKKCQEFNFVMKYEHLNTRKDSKNLIYKDILVKLFNYPKELL